jgi:hypothetical protein
MGREAKIRIEAKEKAKAKAATKPKAPELTLAQRMEAQAAKKKAKAELAAKQRAEAEEGAEGGAAEAAPAAPVVKAAAAKQSKSEAKALKYPCRVCECSFTSAAQLADHAEGKKHKRKLQWVESQAAAGGARTEATASGATKRKFGDDAAEAKPASAESDEAARALMTPEEKKQLAMNERKAAKLAREREKNGLPPAAPEPAARQAPMEEPREKRPKKQKTDGKTRLCKVCECQVNCDDAAQRLHYEGAKHLKRAKAKGLAPKKFGSPEEDAGGAGEKEEKADKKEKKSKKGKKGEQEAAEPQAGKAKALVYDTLWRPNMTPPAGVLGFSCAVCGFVPSLHTDAAHVALHAQGKKHKLCERARAGDALANRRLRELQGLREEKEQKKKKTAKEAHEKYRCVAGRYGAVRSAGARQWQCAMVQLEVQVRGSVLWCS